MAAAASANKSGTDLPLYGLWGSSASDVWAVGPSKNFSGTTGTILHFDGVRWSPVSTGIAGILASVWGTSQSNVWAVGGAYVGDEEPRHGGIIIHFDGKTWTRVQDPFLVCLNGETAHTLGGRALRGSGFCKPPVVRDVQDRAK